MIVLPWLGERVLSTHSCRYILQGRSPDEHGWHEFRVTPWRTTRGRYIAWVGEKALDAPERVFSTTVRGYVVGDRLLSDDASENITAMELFFGSEAVHLLPDGLQRFARVRAGRLAEGEPLVFIREDFPLGPEEEVTRAYEDEFASVVNVPNASAALRAAFAVESWRRSEVRRMRAEEEKKRREEEERLALEARREEIRKALGDGAGRREVATVDFETAARAALAVGGAQYLDHRPSTARGDMVVRFRVDGRRFECVCNARTLRIVESGICLRAYDDEGTTGDTRFTLESLPGVIRQAQRERKLVVFRHAD